jgi:hypothetical protein
MDPPTLQTELWHIGTEVSFFLVPMCPPPFF